MGRQEPTQQRQATKSKIQEEAAGQKSKRLVGGLEVYGTGQVSLWKGEGRAGEATLDPTVTNTPRGCSRESGKARLCRKQTKNLVSPRRPAPPVSRRWAGPGEREGEGVLHVLCPLTQATEQRGLSTLPRPRVATPENSHLCGSTEEHLGFLPTPASQADRCDPRTSTPAHRIVPGAPGMMESPQTLGKSPKVRQGHALGLEALRPCLPSKVQSDHPRGTGSPRPELPARDSRQPGSLGTGPQGPCCSRVPPRT